MSLELSPSPPRQFRVNYNSIVNGLLFLLVASGSVTFIEPAPYDFLLIAFLGLWLLSPFTIHVSALPIIGLVAINVFASFLAVIPWFDADESVIYWAHSLYLSISLALFVIVFGNDSARRAELCLQGLLASCVIAAVLGIVSWFDINGAGASFTMGGRAMGPFKDPNVFGSYLVVGHLYLLQRILTGQARSLFAYLMTIAAMILIMFGVLLSFSRGSWGSLTVASTLLCAFTFAATTDQVQRRRMVLVFSAIIGVAVIGVLIALSFEQIRDIFLVRASFSHDYDLGENGRFGNHLRSMPMLLDRPFGMGPLRFRTFFVLDPHNSYIGAFANNGWLGGFCFLLTVGLSIFVGLRLCFTPSPYRRPAHVFTIIMLMFFIQGLQIDIDHWRFVYIYIGAVWGLETGRRRWLENGGAFEEPAFLPERAAAS